MKVYRVISEKDFEIKKYLESMILLQKTPNMSGGINLRIGHNENIYYGGNIGYEIAELYISCNPNNIASQKVIESLPNCTFVEKANLPAHNDGYLRGEREKLIYKVKLDD